MARYKYQGNFSNNQFLGTANSSTSFVSRSPADLSDVLAEISYDDTTIEDIVGSAVTAQKKWAKESITSRVEHVLRFKDVLKKHIESFAEIISRETGKPLWESKMEVQSSINKIDITIEAGLKLIEEQTVENALPGINGRLLFRPKGLLLVIGPFNFPLHLPNGHIIPALLTGNAVIFKPSEITPLVAQFYAQCILEAKIPAGIFNLIQGDSNVGKKLVSNKKIDGILFTGSYENGLRIKEATLKDYWKILALEMGGKNAAIVWDDADLPKALYECILGAFSTTGQRCSCTSRIILNRKIADKFLERFVSYTKKLTIGHWNDAVFMGPLINPKSYDAYVNFQTLSKNEGNQILLLGEKLESRVCGYYVSPSIHLVHKSSKLSEYQSCEIFGPNVAVYIVDSLEEALEISESTEFGLVTSFFSKSKQLFDYVIDHVQSGQINWNRSTVGASSKLPFGGVKKSGNDRPSALFAVYYTTYATSILEDTGSLSKEHNLKNVDIDFYNDKI